MGDIIDDYSLLIMQVVRILSYQSNDYQHYSLLLPKTPLRILVMQYKVPIEIAFEIVRPGIKHISTMNNEEWKDLCEQVKSTVSEHLKDDNYLVKGYSTNDKITKYLANYKTRYEELLPIEFYTAFWFLTLDSIYFPAKLYSEKIDELRVINVLT